MAIQVAIDGKIYQGAYDLSGSMNRMGLDVGVETHDVSVFGDSSRVRAAGLYTVRFNAAGFWEAGAGEPDDAAAAYHGLVGVPVTLCPGTGAVGQVAYVAKTVQGEYTPLDKQHGQPQAFTVSGEASGAGVGRGQVIGSATASATGNGTACEVGAVSASQKMYAALHVLSVAGGPSMTIKLQSDDNSGFSSPTDRHTFAAVTAAGYEFAAVSGAITDTYWRYTISAFTGTSVTFVLAIGIGPA